jgi:hypothetical protein
VKFELEFYIPEDGILHIDRRENFTVAKRVLTASSDSLTMDKLHHIPEDSSYRYSVYPFYI